MSRPASPREVFERLVHGVADGRWDELPDLYAEDAVVVHPFEPSGAPPLVGRDALREHFRPPGDGTELPFRFQPRNIVVHQTTDPEVIVAEFEYHGTVVATGAPLTLPAVFILRVRDGRIVSSRDYVDHAAFERAAGQG